MSPRNSDLHMQLFTNIAYTSSSLFVPIYAVDMGAGSAQIGAIVSSYSVALLLSNYTLGRLSDYYGRRGVLAVSLSVAAAFAFLQLIASNPTELLVVRFFLGLSAGSSSSLIAYAIDLKRDIGSFSSYASLGGAIGQALAGTIVYLLAGRAAGRALIDPVFLTSSVLLLAAFFLSLSTPRGHGRAGRMRFIPVGAFSKSRAAYISLALRHFGATAIWAIFPIFCFALTPATYSYGQRLALVSVVYVFNSIIQVLSMHYLTGRMKANTLILAGISMSSLTFLSFTLVSNYVELMSTQLLLGVSWSFMYVGGLRFVVERSSERGTAAGMLSSVMALSGIGGPLAGGALADMVAGFGASTFQSYLSIMYAACAITAVAAFAFYRMEYAGRKRAGAASGQGT